MDEPRVLVVEDDAMCREIAMRWLRRRGYLSVVGAPDGREGLDAYKAMLPDIVWVDPNMPGLDGVAMLERLALPNGTDRPWVVLFTAASHATIDHLMQLGLFDDVLRKPCVTEAYADCMARARAGLAARRGGG